MHATLDVGKVFMNGAGPMIVLLLAIFVFYAVCLWRIFEKAGRPGWAAFIPIYNYIVMAEIAGKPSWWGLLPLIPFVGIIFAIILLVQFAAAFGKGVGFALGLIFLGFIFLPLLAFGDAQYGGGTREQRGFAPVMPAR